MTSRIDDVKQVVQSLSAGAKALHAQIVHGVEAERMMREIAEKVSMVAGSPVTVSLVKMGQDIVAHKIDMAPFDYCEVKEPAREVRKAAASVKSSASELKAFLADERFERRMPLPWRRGLAQRVPPAEIVATLGGIAAACGFAGLECEQAMRQILRAYDVRNRIVPEHSPPELPKEARVIERIGAVELPQGSYTSQGRKVRDLHMHLSALQVFLEHVAEKAKRGLEDNTLDGEAYRPGAVIEQAAFLGRSIASAIQSCNDLVGLACAPVGKAFSRRAKPQELQDAKIPKLARPAM